MGTRKGTADTIAFSIEINQWCIVVESNQRAVAEELSKCFSTRADDIGCKNTLLLTDDFNNNPPVCFMYYQ